MFSKIITSYLSNIIITVIAFFIVLLIALIGKMTDSTVLVEMGVFSGKTVVIVFTLAAVFTILDIIVERKVARWRSS